MLLLGLRWVRHKFNEVITDPSCEFMLTVSSQSHGLNTVNSLQSFSQACLPIKLSLPGGQQAPQDRGTGRGVLEAAGAAPPILPSFSALPSTAKEMNPLPNSRHQWWGQRGPAVVERFAGEHGWWGDRAGEPAGCLSGGWGWGPGIGTRSLSAPGCQLCL